MTPFKTRVQDAAAALLGEHPDGFTPEALAPLVAARVGQQLAPRALSQALREIPRRALEGSDGRWKARPAAPEIDGPDEEIEGVAASDAASQGGAARGLERALERGRYVVFDIEATGTGPTSPDTEILQIAAQRIENGAPGPMWMSFARPSSGTVSPVIERITAISTAEVAGAPPIESVLRDFFAYVGDLPLVAHNCEGYDGPLIAATCERVGVPLPPSFEVLDTLPLSRILLPREDAHRVGTLAAYYGCKNPNAHRADADVEMLGGVVRGLEREFQSPDGALVWELLRRAGSRWTQILTPPASIPDESEWGAILGRNLVPMLPPREADFAPPAVDEAGLEAAFTRAEAGGKTRRAPQVQMSQFLRQTLGDGEFAVVEAGTGTGKSLGYLLPAALRAVSSGAPVAVSTYTRVLQAQLVERELPFVAQLVPGLRFALLQGRSNYLSLGRLAEELEDALEASELPLPRAAVLALLVRFAAQSAHGNLEELGGTPRALDRSFEAEGALMGLLGSVRATEETAPRADLPDFYRRARENSEIADIVVINHALLLSRFGVCADPRRAEADPFVSHVVCDEAHTLEDAATQALEIRLEENALRALLRDLRAPRYGLIAECRHRLKMERTDSALAVLSSAVEEVEAALDSLAGRLRRYVEGEVVVSSADLEAYGVRVRIEESALGAAGGPELSRVALVFAARWDEMRLALDRVFEGIVERVRTTTERRVLRLLPLGATLCRAVAEVNVHFNTFWGFSDPSGTVRIIELGRVETLPSGETRSPVAMGAVPINVGPLLWRGVWSRLESAAFTSATLAVTGSKFDFFRARVGLDEPRVAHDGRAVRELELPHPFDYRSNALLMLPGDLPAPRDTALKRDFPRAVADFLGRFIPFFGGKTLSLFTANSRRDYVFSQLQEPLAQAGFPLLSQGEGSAARMIEEFRGTTAASLLGSRSLWEGVDVPGESLSFLTIEKLPYPSLGDPVEAARMNAVENAGGDAFKGYLLPKMVILLKQGFGRLLRSETDRGAVILLDKRLKSAMYRPEVLRSLPDPTIGYESDGALFRRVAEWMGMPFDPALLPAKTTPDTAILRARLEFATPFVADVDWPDARARLLELQNAIWKQDSFRGGQEEIMRATLSGDDHLTLLPTGAGKSRTFQLPALLRPGLTLVISPLIALIRDQVETLRDKSELGCVAALVSGMDAASQEETLRQAVAGELRLLYISPERLRDPRFRSALPRLPLVQLVVDEAHCIATWGHDFRPDFLEVAALLPASGGQKLPVHALTATATPAVREEIKARLDMGTTRAYSEFVGDFARPNLVFRTLKIAKASQREGVAVAIVRQLVRDRVRGGAGVVYVATRKGAEQLARLLRERNIAAAAYHGGMETPKRHGVQERFMQDELDVVVATSAFGMGVDKANIRFVLHFDHPSSLEAYVQEAGRAGRDGAPAWAILLSHPQSERTLRYIARSSRPTPAKIADFARSLRKSRGAVVLSDGARLCSISALAEDAELDEAQSRVLLHSFEEAGLIERGEDCTLEATILPLEERTAIVGSIAAGRQRDLASLLFDHLGAQREREVLYNAPRFVEEAGGEPREVDALLNELSARDQILFRAYSRGLTARITPALSEPGALDAIEKRFAEQDAQFEARLGEMLGFINLRGAGSHCRSAHLINYLTGGSAATRCGQCDLCAPSSTDLPWDAAALLPSPTTKPDVKMAILAALLDHSEQFGRGTIERMLLGTPQTTFGGVVRPIAKGALRSDHFGALDGTSPAIKPKEVSDAFDALWRGGCIATTTKALTQGQFEAVHLTAKGSDTLAGAAPLPGDESSSTNGTSEALGV